MTEFSQPQVAITQAKSIIDVLQCPVSDAATKAHLVNSGLYFLLSGIDGMLYACKALGFPIDEAILQRINGVSERPSPSRLTYTDACRWADEEIALEKERNPVI